MLTIAPLVLQSSSSPVEGSVSEQEQVNHTENGTATVSQADTVVGK